MLTDKVLLITGGTGSFGQAFTKIALEEHNPKAIRVFSRGELLQQEMRIKFNDNPKLRFFIGDVRDKERVYRAMNRVDIVVHAAALKQVPACEYNPIEAIRTNIQGAINIIDSAIENKVERVIAISSDKAVHPVNLYGATKMVMEKLFTQANVYARKKTKFSCVRYGNVIGSRGSVIPLFLEQKKTGRITITDQRMTRFWITLEQGVRFVINCVSMMRGGEIFVPKIKGFSVMELVDIIAPSTKKEIIGIRPGEKLHEVLVTEDEAKHTIEYEDYFTILPEFPFWTENTYQDLTGNKLFEDFRYASNIVEHFNKEEIMRMISDSANS